MYKLKGGYIYNHVWFGEYFVAFLYYHRDAKGHKNSGTCFIDIGSFITNFELHITGLNRHFIFYER